MSVSVVVNLISLPGEFCLSDAGMPRTESLGGPGALGCIGWQSHDVHCY